MAQNFNGGFGGLAALLAPFMPQQQNALAQQMQFGYGGGINPYMNMLGGMYGQSQMPSPLNYGQNNNNNNGNGGNGGQGQNNGDGQNGQNGDNVNDGRDGFVHSRSSGFNGRTGGPMANWQGNGPSGMNGGNNPGTMQNQNGNRGPSGMTGGPMMPWKGNGGNDFGNTGQGRNNGPRGMTGGPMMGYRGMGGGNDFGNDRRMAMMQKPMGILSGLGRR